MDKNKTVDINFKYNNGERTIEMFFDDVTPMDVVHELNIITRTVLNRLVELLQDTNIDNDKKVKN